MSNDGNRICFSIYGYYFILILILVLIIVLILILIIILIIILILITLDKLDIWTTAGKRLFFVQLLSNFFWTNH